MPKMIDLANRRFGRLLVVDRAGNDSQGCVSWNCICDCGNSKVASYRHLKNGYTKSCGCLKVDGPMQANRIHGHARRGDSSGTYSTWQAMLERCRNPKNRRYGDYGSRGITVCERWAKFENFLADMGERPDGMTLDRFPDVDGNYEPDNCRWATRIEQANNKRNNRLVSANGEVRTMAQWARDRGIPYKVVQGRLDIGWSANEALEFEDRQPIAGRRIDGTYGKGHNGS